jgi:hypothetical protein
MATSLLSLAKLAKVAKIGESLLTENELAKIVVDLCIKIHKATVPACWNQSMKR